MQSETNEALARQLEASGQYKVLRRIMPPPIGFLPESGTKIGIVLDVVNRRSNLTPALPQLFPAIIRWEIQPNAGTPMMCGAVVPRFGQSGGGVEVFAPQGATNRGPIANPVVLDPLLGAVDAALMGQPQQLLPLTRPHEIAAPERRDVRTAKIHDYQA